MAPRRPETLIGREIADQFRLDRYLGRGRSTLVFAAVDLSTGDEVAIKLLASTLTRDVGFMRRFRHVMRAAAAMEHPNVLSVMAWGEERELFVVTELMAGPLRSVMGPRGGLSAGQTASMAVDASRGLAFLAQRNLVHRRLHPSNLLVSDDGAVVVADAGLAWILAHQSGQQFSDFRYLAPEAGGGTTGAPLDVFALGLVMVETLSGDIPLLAGDVNSTLGMRHGQDVVVDPGWGRVGRAIAATVRSDPERRIPAAQLDVGLMALIDQLGDGAAALPRVDPALRSDELEAMRLMVGNRIPAVAAQATATQSAASGSDRSEARRSEPPSGRAVDNVVDSSDAPAPPLPARPVAPVGDPAGLQPERPKAADPSAADSSGAGSSGAGQVTGGPSGAGSSEAGQVTADPPTAGLPADGQGPARRPAKSRRRTRPEPRQADDVAKPPDPDGPSSEELATRRNWTLGLLAMLAIVLVVILAVQRLLVSPAGTVPNLVGATVGEARAEATEQRWRLNTTEVRKDGTEPDEILSQRPAVGTKLDAGEPIDITVSLGQTLVSLPDLEGLDEAEAKAIVTFAGMKLGTVTNEYADIKPGIVMSYEAPFVDDDELPKDSQLPKGSQLAKGSTVDLVVSDGARPRKVPADLEGDNAFAVIKALEDASLKPEVEEVQDPTVQLGYVVSVEPASGTQLELGATVKVRVSSPRDKTIVPDMAGKSTVVADAELRAAGLNVLGIQGPAGSPVKRTVPAAGAEVSEGTAVRLVTE